MRSDIACRRRAARRSCGNCIAKVDRCRRYIPVDPSYPAPRIRGMLDDAEAQWILTNCNFPSEAANDITRIDIGQSADETTAIPKADGPEGSDTAYIIFTSGSTGRPKGVEVSHRSLANYVDFANYVDWAASYYLSEKPLAWPLFSPLSFDLTVTSIFVPLVSGGRIVVYSESPGAKEITIRRVVEDNQVDIVKLTPAHLALLQAMDLSKSRIQKLIVGGENLKSELARSISSYFGNRVEIFNEYGPTEGTVACMIHRFDPQNDTAPSVPIGHVIDNAHVYILNEAGELQPEGAIGELYIGGAGVARGYVNRHDLTNERFVDNPFRQGETMYRSGDLARRNPDGTFTCLGRADEQFKLNGIRMEPGEIEAAILGFPGIAECAVKLAQRSPRLEEESGKFCVRCGLSGMHPDAVLDEESVCKICRVYEEEENRAQSYFLTAEDLQAIVDDARAGATGKQDCMMLLSGGKDSTYALCQLVELGLTPLVFTLDNGYISDGAKSNIRRVVDDLGLELVESSTPAMNEIFVDSLHRFSNVCNGCFKVIYTLSMKIARERGIRHIFTGLSRGQIFETRVADLFRQRIFDPPTIDRTIIEARKAYHRAHDGVFEHMDTSHFDDDSIFEDIQFIDFYRYTNVSLDTMLTYLRDKVPWVRPADTGRSTNCLINEAGIYVHTKERRYHNYSLPYSWDVRLGHKERDAAREELDDDIDVDNVQRILGEIGYTPRESGNDGATSSLLVGYYVAESQIDEAELKASMLRRLPSDFVPTQFVQIAALPLTPNGKLDRNALPEPEQIRPDIGQHYVAPETEIDSKLAEIWADILGMDRVGIDDNFFDLGGDSIMNIQIVAAAGKHGIRLSPQQLFDYPTIRELSTVVGSAAEIASQQGPVTGEVPLTPIQMHFLSRDLDNPQAYCQYVLLRCSSSPDILALQEAVRKVTMHHDALRAQFRKAKTGWRQEFLETGSIETVVRSSSIDTTADIDDVVASTVETMQRQLANSGDSLFKLLAINVAETNESYLLLLASHLVVDAVSWWVIVEDLEQAYTTLCAGNPVRLMAKTTSMPHWAQALSEFTKTEAALATFPMWQAAAAAGQFLVPPDGDLPGSNDLGDTATLELVAGKKLTRSLLTDAVTNWRLQPQELMLTAFAVTIGEWLGRVDLAIDMEGHGRELISSEVDLLRTVGWFTSLHPVILSLENSSSDADRLRAVKAQLRNISNGGIAYGALRYLSASREIRSVLDVPTSPLLFNYLGQWRRQTTPQSWLTFEKPVMASYGSSGPRQYVFEINAAVFDGELRIAWTYGTQYHHRRTVEILAKQFLEKLSDLTEFCASASDDGLTPQDFPDAQLSESELDDILTEFGEN
jgi:amino acid adenylation domain-containing protein/non-ribosomal peptide synthase protein (TIGR01720 family)